MRTAQPVRPADSASARPRGLLGAPRSRGAIRLQLRSVLEHRDLALRAVAAACKMVTPKPRGRVWNEFQHQVLSAVGEGFNNIVLHGHPHRPGTAKGSAGNVDLRIQTGPGHIRIELRDWGRGFDPKAVNPPAIEALPESGLGLHIMQSFMTMSYRAGRPNLLTLSKTLDERPSARAGKRAV
jgi:anti-sigma regulatory factor (Ser/Thr protein kinase)